MDRRNFLKAAAAATSVLAGATEAGADTRSEIASRNRIQAFDYDGVRLGKSRWSDQYQKSRDFYFGVSNDDILQGFRAAAQLPAPGRPLGGWCAQNSSTVFGQWLSGMSRMAKATGDTEMRDKAVYLMTEFAKTVPPDGNCRMGHYPFEKLICGLVDIHKYIGHPAAMPLAERVTDWATKTFDRTRLPASPKPWENHSGRPLEWYTVGENLFRAYAETGNAKFREFAEVWLYHPYWNKFADTSSPTDASGVHAYSHVNSFSSAAMAYAVTGDEKFLRIIRNAYDFLQKSQTYATGGFGPVERIMPAGSLGKALEYQPNTFEAPCGSWAGLKLARYLTQFTGEARYGDWAERLLYNGIGSALQINGAGRHFYYADYRVGAAVKIFSRTPYTCCSGTYIQDTADFHNLIYYRSDTDLYVSLYVPSEVTWKRPEGVVTLLQETQYPEAETSTLTLRMTVPMQFGLRMRVPEWARDVSVKVNGNDANVPCTPGTWASINRLWANGDRVELHIPLKMRYQAVDPQHPKRVAVVRGPVVLVQEGNVHEPIFKLPDNDEELTKQLVPMREPGVFKYVPPGGANVQAPFRPYYTVIEALYYRMYFDLNDLPVVLWS
jgi:DUF1680 family protein